MLVVGGLARLEQQYRCCASNDVTVEVANFNSSRLRTSVAHVDSVVVIVPNVSHAAANKVQQHARRLGLRVNHATSSSAKHVTERILELTQGEKQG